MLRHLVSLRDEATTRRNELREILAGYVNGEGPFPERLHITVVAARLLLDQAQAQVDWATWALPEVEKWPDTRASGDPKRLRSLLEAAIGTRGDAG